MGKLADYFYNNRAGCKDWKGEPFQWIQEKKDGYRLTFIKEVDGVIIALGRTQDYWEKLRWCEKISAAVHLMPRGTVVDGELHVQGMRSTDVVTAMNEKDERMTFSAFAAPVIANESYTLQGQELEIINSWLEQRGFISVPTTSYIGTLNGADMLDEIRRKKIEGYVLKNAHYDQWYKLKPEKTCDLVVTGVKEGSGKYRGMLGALQCSAYDKEWQMVEVASVGGGFNDEQRERFQKEGCIGKVVEVMYQDVLAKGGLRYPRFIRFRDDKSVKECTMEQFES